MRLTKAHNKAGATELNGENCNGSCIVLIELDKIDRESNGSNFRTWTQAHTNEISGQNFNKLAVRNPILYWNKDTKAFQSIDGRHTIAALKENGHKFWSCDVFFKITKQEAGNIFYQLTQNSKRMGVWDAYSAALASEYQWAMDISQRLKYHKLTTPHDLGFNAASADFNGFTPLKDSWDLGLNFLNTFLAVLASWKTGRQLHKVARSNPFQRGLMDFLEQNNNKYSERQLLDLLANDRFELATPVHIENLAAQLNPGVTRLERTHYKQAFVSATNANRIRLRIAG